MKSPRRKIKFEILPAAGARFLGKKRKPRAWIKITEILVTYIYQIQSLYNLILPMAILRFGHPSYFFFIFSFFFFFEEVVHKILRILTLYILRGKLGKVSTVLHSQ